MQGHVIVCGFGYLGQSVVELLLDLEESVVVITKEIRRVASLRLDTADVRIIQADARDRAALEEAGVRTARAIIAAADDDLANIEIALDVAQLAPGTPVVVRLFDQNLARKLESSFDVRRALAMSALAAPVFASSALGGPLLATLRLGGRPYVVAEQRGGDEQGDSGFIPLALGPDGGTSRAAFLASEELWQELAAPRPREERRTLRQLGAAVQWPFRMWRGVPLAMRITFALLVLLTAVSVFVFSVGLRLAPLDAFYFMVTTITTTGYGDITPFHASAPLKVYACLVMLLGSATTALFYSFFTDFIVAERFRRITESPEITEKTHVIVVGLGSVGYRVVDTLRRLGVATVGVDVDPAAPFVAEARGLAPVLIGDARFAFALAKAGITRARAVLAMTSNDATNIEVALAAREQSTSVRIIARLFDPAFASKVEGVLPIDLAVSASRVAAPSFVASALFPHVLGAFVRDGQFAVVTEEEGPATWGGRSVTDIMEADRVQVTLRSAGAEYVPLGREEKLRAGGRYVLVRRRELRAHGTRK
jgi:Trk K+ transport system NAD-binding subunit